MRRCASLIPPMGWVGSIRLIDELRCHEILSLKIITCVVLY